MTNQTLRKKNVWTLQAILVFHSKKMYTFLAFIVDISFFTRNKQNELVQQQ